jgi:methyl-accepting chemotaxis protein
MNAHNGYSLQRTMIIYILLIGFAALLVSSEFVMDTHSTALKQELTHNFQRYNSGELEQDQVYEPLVRIRNKAMMMVGVILAVVVIVLTMFIKTITEPLQHMVEVSKAISAGDLSRTTGSIPKTNFPSCPPASTTCPPTCRRSSCFPGRYAIQPDG